MARQANLMLARRKQFTGPLVPPGSSPRRRLPEGRLLLLAAHIKCSDYGETVAAKRASLYLGFHVTDADIEDAFALRRKRKDLADRYPAGDRSVGVRLIVARGKRLQ